MRKPDLSKLSLAGGPAVPTMIVPPGTQIGVDAQGQVSIRTPGNLVLQNSGAYATLESVSGSIRVEPDVHVEAITVRCADTCLVQGSLTAWRVVARTLHVDGDGEAHVVMQETERLEVGKNGRLVGNFRSEKELFDLFSRFAGQVRALPAPATGGDGTPSAVTVVAEGGDELAGDHHPGAEATAGARRGGSASATVGADSSPQAAVAAAHAAEVDAVDAELEDDDLVPPRGESAAGAPPVGLASLPDLLGLTLFLLESQPPAADAAKNARRAHAQLVALLRDGDLETLRHTYKTLFARLSDGGEATRRARQAVGAHFEHEARAGAAAG
jgi:hypothetical protein